MDDEVPPPKKKLIRVATSPMLFSASIGVNRVRVRVGYRPYVTT